MTKDEINFEDHTILIVDDSVNNLHLMSKVLYDKGYRVRAAKCAGDAFCSIAAEKPDLILLDVRLPDHNGYDMCTLLKADPKTTEIPIIFLSAMNDIENKLRAFEVGGADYISKPFNESEVLARVNFHLDICRLRKNLEHRTHELLLVNERLKLEMLERKHAEAALTQCDNRFETLFRQMPLGVALINSINGRILEVNKKFSEVLGGTAQQITSINWMNFCHPDEEEKNLDNIEILNTPERKEFQVEKRHLLPNGENVLLRVTIVPIGDFGEAELCHLCTIEKI